MTIGKTYYRLLERDDESERYNDWKWVEDAPRFACQGDAFEWLEAQDIHPLAIESHYRAVLGWVGEGEE